MVAQDKFVMESVIILAWVEEIEFIDAFAKQILALYKYIKEAFAQDNFVMKAVSILAFLEAI